MTPKGVRLNSAWMIAEQVVRLGIALLLTAWIARALGPHLMGQLSFALALCALLGVVATAGLNRIAVREFVAAAEPGDERRLLATTLAMRWAAGGLMAVVGIVACALLSPENVLLVAILVPGFFFTAFDLVGLLQQARQRADTTVAVRLGAFALSSAIKAALLWLGAGLVAITVACLLDWVIAGVALAVFYRRRHPGVRMPRPDLALARRLFAESKIEILAGFSGMAFLRVDQIMLEAMQDPSQVAIMAVSSRLTEAWYFVPSAIVAASFPVILRLQASDPPAAARRLRRLYRILVAMGIAAGLGAWLLAGPVVRLLYGAQYVAAAPVLVVQAWCGVFMSLGLASGAWLISRREGVLNLRRNALGMAVNVALNLWLIPAHGAVGAAWASLAGAATAYLLYDLVDPRAREMGREKLQALAWR